MSADYERSQEDEMAFALKENRQPLCVYCEKPLDKIFQTQEEIIEWNWNKNLRKYIKQERDGNSDRPYHHSCGAEDWSYVDGELVSY